MSLFLNKSFPTFSPDVLILPRPLLYLAPRLLKMLAISLTFLFHPLKTFLASSKMTAQLLRKFAMICSHISSLIFNCPTRQPFFSKVLGQPNLFIDFPFPYGSPKFQFPDTLSKKNPIYFFFYLLVLKLYWYPFPIIIELIYG